MVFKDLKGRVSLQEPQDFKALERLQDRPFWIWEVGEHKQEDIRTNGYCFFNRVIGLPTKGTIVLYLYAQKL